MAHPRASMILGPGPFRVCHLPSNTDYELDNGHPVLCLPNVPSGGAARLLGAQVIGSDPLVEESGVEIGFQLSENTLRAPDVAVLARDLGGDDGGWATVAPPLGPA